MILIISRVNFHHYNDIKSPSYYFLDKLILGERIAFEIKL